MLNDICEVFLLLAESQTEVLACQSELIETLKNINGESVTE